MQTMLRGVDYRRWGFSSYGGDYRPLAIVLLKLVEEGRFEDALVRAGRDFGPMLLCDWLWEGGYLTVDQLRGLLPGVWSGVEFPSLEFGLRYWLELFKTTGFVTEKPGYERPDEAITVFRGCTWKTRWRMSWTTDLERAQWFADRLKPYFPEATVFRAVCPPRHVLGLMQERQEGEVVVNPYGLKNWNDLGFTEGTVSQYD